MNVNVMGVEMTPDVREWRDDQRRIGSLLVLGVAGILLVVGVLTFVFAQDAANILYWVFFGLLILLLALQVVLFVLSAGAATPAPQHDGAADSYLGRAGGGDATPEPQRGAPVLTLRCGECATEFDLTDTGERPLQHVCPGCGLEGVLRAEDLGEAPAPEAFADEAAAPPAPPEAPALKKLKLRCGGCREVFSIEDSGERPLRRPCPHCGRVGEVR